MQIEEIYKTESHRVLATLIRLLGDFDLAEDALHEAFRAAIEEWPKKGVPENPYAWLVSAGRFKAIDRIRKNSKSVPLEEMGEVAYTEPGPKSVEDDQLRLIFTCCHPALAAEARSALTLREVCGLTTEEIARAFLTTPTTLAQRIVRAKSKIREAKIPYEVPSKEELPERLNTVLQVIYLVFNEGYSATSGDQLVRADISAESIRLARLLVELLPEPEAEGLLALLLLHESRRPARVSAAGDLILLEDQDRSLWDQRLIQEGTELVKKALITQRFGPYSIQAAIAAVHAAAKNSVGTDWNEIVGLYDVLLRLDPSPVVELNRAVAVAMRDGAETGLKLLSGIRQLENYQWFHSAQADLLRRLGRKKEAHAAYQKALNITQLEPEKRFLKKRLAEVSI